LTEEPFTRALKRLVAESTFENRTVRCAPLNRIWKHTGELEM